MNRKWYAMLSNFVSQMSQYQYNELSKGLLVCIKYIGNEYIWNELYQQIIKEARDKRIRGNKGEGYKEFLGWWIGICFASSLIRFPFMESYLMVLFAYSHLVLHFLILMEMQFYALNYMKQIGPKCCECKAKEKRDTNKHLAGRSPTKYGGMSE